MKVPTSVSRIVQLVVLCVSTSVLLAFGKDERIGGSTDTDEKTDGSSNLSSTASPKTSARIKEAIAHVAKCELTLAKATTPKVLKVSEHPLLSFGDPARDNEAGTLWAWSDEGRPIAMMELYRPSDAEAVWISAWTLTSTQLIEMTVDTTETWFPAKSDFALQDFPDSAAVSNRPAVRLRQMKDLIRRFESHEFWDPDNSRFELRCLQTPVLRYADKKNDVFDGCVFVFAHGTNPEILLFVEAQGVSAETSKWQFAAFRLGSAEMHLDLDRKPVWLRDRTPGVVGMPNDAYWLQVSNRETGNAKP